MLEAVTGQKSLSVRVLRIVTGELKSYCVKERIFRATSPLIPIHPTNTPGKKNDPIYRDVGQLSPSLPLKPSQDKAFDSSLPL